MTDPRLMHPFLHQPGILCYTPFSSRDAKVMPRK